MEICLLILILCKGTSILILVTLGTFLPVGMICTTTNRISVPIGAMYLHARMFCALADTSSIYVGSMYLHARMFCTLAHTTSIPVGAMYLHARTFCTLSDTILYPLWAPIFTVITEVWPLANQAVVTNNSTVIIEVVLIEGFLYTTINMGLTLTVQFCSIHNRNELAYSTLPNGYLE